MPLLSHETVEHWYCAANELLISMASIPKAALVHLPIYDAQALQAELDCFHTWFFQLLGYQANESVQTMLKGVYQRLITSALEQPQVFVHRDFHSRNVMVLSDQTLATIDFQDARIGPLTYDAVSLFKDCYASWPLEQVISWVLRFKADCDQVLPHHMVSDTVFIQWFNRMGLQRHLKVLGVFARLSLRDHKHGYLNDLPRVWQYVEQASKHDDALAEFTDWLQTTLKPWVIEQPWWPLS